MNRIGETNRYRCGACGNLTRFDVIRHQKTKEFHHFTTSGALTIEDQQIIEESIESVSCRWCESGTDVTEISITSDD